MREVGGSEVGYDRYRVVFEGHKGLCEIKHTCKETHRMDCSLEWWNLHPLIL